MKPNYTIQTNNCFDKPAFIVCYNFHTLNIVQLVGYYEDTFISLTDKFIIAVFKIKYKQ